MKRPISQADVYHRAEQAKEAAEDEHAECGHFPGPDGKPQGLDPTHCVYEDEVKLSERLIAEVVAEEKVGAVNERVGSPTETLPEPQYTPEKVREMFNLIARKRVNIGEMLTLLAELEHTLAARVGTEHVLYHPRHHTGAKTPTCERCGKRMGIGIKDRAVEFDGRWWHRANCKKER